MEPIIEVEGLKKTFKINKQKSGFSGAIKNIINPSYEYKDAISGIDFKVNQGEMVGFIGPNGAGKSTTVKILSGILYPSAGNVIVNNYVPYKQRKEYVKNIGVVFGQKSQLQWDLAPIDSYELIKNIYKIPDKKYKENLNRFVKLLEMEKFLHQPVRQLSLGQRMRADIAAALLHSPKIVFFDEPTIGVDVVGKERIRNFIRELNCTDNITMIFTTHDMVDIEKVCDRIIIIDEGKKLYDGSLAQIIKLYSSYKEIIIETTDDLPPVGLQDVAINRIDEYRYSLKFNCGEVDIKFVMEYIFNNYKISDIKINDQTVEEIIRKIYSNQELKDGIRK